MADPSITPEPPADETHWQELETEITACRRCPRLVGWREQVAQTRRRAYQDWEYWGRPVPGFGDRQARLLVVGLAPGAHGSNRTGRMFTGDSSGDFLYAALHRAGFASQPTSSQRQDGQQLNDVFITAVCRCAPPANKPAPQEIILCRPFLLAEIEYLPLVKGIIALGRVAFEQMLLIHRLRGAALPSLAFRHNALYPLGAGLPWLLASYHPSRQNTQTGRLSVEMFDQVWQQARRLLAKGK